MYRDRTFTFSLAVTQNGVAFNLTGASIRMTAKWQYSDPDASAVFALTVGAGITVTNAAGGLATVTIAANKTASLPANLVPLVYDIQVTDASSNVWTVADGTLYVQPNVSITTP
jgi:hypothetical protein